LDSGDKPSRTERDGIPHHAQLWRPCHNARYNTRRRHLGVSQARVSDLMNGKFNKFSLDMLARLAERAGLRCKLRRLEYLI
jgi:Helix-turn-helix domain